MALHIKREEPDEPGLDGEEEVMEVEAEVLDVEMSSDTRAGSVDLINYLPRVPLEVRQGFRDFTDEEWALCLEDYNRGFALLTDEDMVRFQVPDDPLRTSYRTREKLSCNCVKVSAGMVGKWIQAKTNKSRPLYPPQYLEDELGLTPQSVAVFKILMRYTCRRRFKANELGAIEWDRLNRDASPIKDPLYSEENPEYVLAGAYWQAVEEMYLDYLNLMDWIQEYKKRLSIETSYQAEFTPPLTWGDNAARSEARAREELAKKQITQYWVSHLNQMVDQVVELAKDKATEAKAKGYEAAAEVFKETEPTPPDDEEDLWTEQ